MSERAEGVREHTCYDYLDEAFATEKIIRNWISKYCHLDLRRL